MENFSLDACVVKYGCDNIDFEKTTLMLSSAYWSIGIQVDEVKRGAVHSALVMGVFYNNEQIGYARVVSDKTRFAYIMDVFVDVHFRRNGVAKLMVDSILKNDDLHDVYQWLLITKDAHAVYQKSGLIHRLLERE